MTIDSCLSYLEPLIWSWLQSEGRFPSGEAWPTSSLQSSTDPEAQLQSHLYREKIDSSKISYLYLYVEISLRIPTCTCMISKMDNKANYALTKHIISWPLYIVAKCPGLAGTVPEFAPMSRLCPGLPDFAALSRNLARLYKWRCGTSINSV